MLRGAGWASNTEANATARWDYRDPLNWPGWNDVTVSEWRAPRCDGNFVRRHYNGFGQLTQEQRPGQGWSLPHEGCGSAVSPLPEVDVDYLYDGLGRQTLASVPHARTADWLNQPAYWGEGYSETQYDALGRVTQSFAPNREQTMYSYVGRQTKVTGVGRNGYPNKVLRWTETDGLGNLAVVRSGSSSGTEVSSVSLDYDALGNLKTVTMPSVGTTTLTYDLGGRKVEMIDPDLGKWTYDYNRQGQLVRQTDANGWTAFLYYDSLGRLASQYFQPHTACPAAGATLQRTLYGYDGGHSASNRSRGQLTSVTKYDSNGTLTYTRSERFDGAGRLASQAVRVWSSGVYTTSYSYDAWSRPQTTVYPDGEQVTVGYGAQGLPVRLWSDRKGVLVNGAVKDGPYSDAAAYDLTGQLVQARYPAGGNLWRTAASFPWLGSDGNSNRRLQYLLVGSGPGSGDRYQTYLSYDTYANVKARSEFVGPDRQENYGYLYDVQNRVSRGTYRQYAPGDVLLETLVEGHTYAAAGWPQTFGARSFSQLRGHFSAPADGGYVFDANGNVRNRAGQEFIWDAENHLAQVNWGSPSASEYYAYDESGVRVRKAEGMTGGPVTANTFYLFPHYERRTSAGVTIPTKRYFFGNMLVAQDEGGQLTYLHTDHLGSRAPDRHERRSRGRPALLRLWPSPGQER